VITSFKALSGADDFEDEAVAVAVLGNQILAAGTAGVNSSSGPKFALARYNLDDGTLDQNFGVHGEVVSDVSEEGGSTAVGMAAHTDGTIIVGGWGHHPSAVGNYINFEVAKYLSDGTLDTSFGVGGSVLTLASSAT